MGNKYLIIENSLFIYYGRLIVLKAEISKIKIIIIRLYYNTLLITYLNKNKTK